MKTSQLVCIHCPKCGSYLARYTEATFKEFFVEAVIPRKNNYSCHSCQSHFLCQGGELTEIPAGTPGTHVDNLTLLVLPPQDKPLYLIVKGSNYYSPSNADAPNQAELIEEHHKYFYEEHTCLINILGNTFMVVRGGDADDHGMFDYVKAVVITDIETKFGVKWSEIHDSNALHHELLTRLFPEVFR